MFGKFNPFARKDKSAAPSPGNSTESSVLSPPAPPVASVKKPLLGPLEDAPSAGSKSVPRPQSTIGYLSKTPDLRPGLRELVGVTAEAIRAGVENHPDEVAAGRYLTSLLAGEGRTRAETLDTQARTLLMDTSLQPHEQAQVERIFKAILDIRTALRGAECAALFLALLRREAEERGNFTVDTRAEEIATLVGKIALQTADALNQTGSPHSALAAARAVEEVRAAYHPVEASLRFQRMKASQETSRRLTRAALWSLMISAESMARVAARFAMPANPTASKLN